MSTGVSNLSVSQKIPTLAFVADGDPAVAEAPLHGDTDSNEEGNDSLEDIDSQTANETAQEEETRPSGRGRGRGRGRARGRMNWRRLLKDPEWKNIGKLPVERNSTRGRGRGKAKKAIDPGKDFKSYQASASQAYMEDDLETAADYARQAIQANPEVFQAHSLLSEIFRRQGKDEDSVTALWTGAYTVRHPTTWALVADRMIELAGMERNESYLKKAIDCYAEAIKLKGLLEDGQDYALRVRKFDLYKELGDSKFARLDCKNILRIWPGNTRFLREYAELCAAWQDKSELIRAKYAYDRAFELYSDQETFGDGGDTWSHLNIYLELVDMVGEPAEGTSMLKRLARWFLGRKEETFWDRYTEDDREFDNDVSRRGLVSEFQAGKASFDRLKYGDGLPIELRVRLGLFRLKMGIQYGEEALRHFQPLVQYMDMVEHYHDLFLQVATSLRHAGYIKEAADYYDPLRDVPEMLDETIWMAMATCYEALDRNEEAAECFEEVVNIRGANFARAGSHLVKLYKDVGQIEKAQLLYNEVIKLGRRDLLDNEYRGMVPEPPSGEKDSQHITNHSSRAVKGFTFAPTGPGAFTEFQLEGPDYGNSHTLGRTGAAGGSLENTPLSSSRKRHRPRPILPATRGETGGEGEETSLKRQRLRKPYVRHKPRVGEERIRQFQDAEARVRANYSLVQVHWPSVKEDANSDAVEQWREYANSMLEDFTAMKIFFPDRDKHVKIKAVDDGLYVKMSTRHNKNPDYDINTAQGFCNIPFPEWHRIFVDLALLYARQGEQDKCYKILQDVLFGANVFFLRPDLDRTNYGAGICCALIFNDCQYLIDLTRKLITKSDFRAAMPFQLFAAVNQLCYGSNWFSAGPSQKFMLRMVKMIDFMAMAPAVRDRFDWSIHQPGLEHRAQRFADTPHQLDPAILMTYGHMVAVANHSHSALPYYFRALALQPDNPVVNLCCATMWIQNSMKRQTDNRQFGIAQGLAFLYRYHSLRIADSSSCSSADRQEAEYNVARLWHHLGLTHLAIRGYERVLKLSEAVQAEYLARTDVSVDEDEAEDFAMEAAFALQGIYSLAGNDTAAKAISEQWLVL